MDKKNVQKSFVKNGLTDEIFCLDNLFLSSQIKPLLNFFVMIFFEKKYLKIFSCQYLGNVGNRKNRKKSQELCM